MGVARTFFQRVASLVEGSLYGDVYPRREEIPVPAQQARTAALRALADYYAELTFWRAGARGEKPIGFQVARENILVNPPEAPHKRVFPSIDFTAGPFTYDQLSNQPYEPSDGQFGQGTVLVRQAEYQEKVQVEVNASKEPERQALLAGLEVAMSPLEERAGLMLTARDFFGMPAFFLLRGGTRSDLPDSVRDRRTAKLQVDMRIEIVRLVRHTTLQTRTKLNVDLDADSPAAPFDAGPAAG